MLSVVPFFLSTVLRGVQTDALVSGFIRVLGRVAHVIPEGDSIALKARQEPHLQIYQELSRTRLTLLQARIQSSELASGRLCDIKIEWISCTVTGEG